MIQLVVASSIPAAATALRVPALVSLADIYWLLDVAGSSTGHRGGISLEAKCIQLPRSVDFQGPNIKKEKLVRSVDNDELGVVCQSQPMCHFTNNLTATAPLFRRFSRRGLFLHYP